MTAGTMPPSLAALRPIEGPQVRLRRYKPFHLPGVSKNGGEFLASSERDSAL
jgi:hypothetical protein